MLFGVPLQLAVSAKHDELMDRQWSRNLYHLAVVQLVAAPVVWPLFQFRVRHARIYCLHRRAFYRTLQEPRPSV